jgi:hypothetical protein
MLLYHRHYCDAYPTAQLSPLISLGFRDSSVADIPNSILRAFTAVNNSLIESPFNFGEFLLLHMEVHYFYVLCNLLFV